MVHLLLHCFLAYGRHVATSLLTLSSPVEYVLHRVNMSVSFPYLLYEILAVTASKQLQYEKDLGIEASVKPRKVPSCTGA